MRVVFEVEVNFLMLKIDPAKNLVINFKLNLYKIKFLSDCLRSSDSYIGPDFFSAKVLKFVRAQINFFAT